MNVLHLFWPKKYMQSEAQDTVRKTTLYYQDILRVSSVTVRPIDHLLLAWVPSLLHMHIHICTPLYSMHVSVQYAKPHTHTGSRGLINFWDLAHKLVSLIYTHTTNTHSDTHTLSNISALIFLLRHDLSKWNRKQRQCLCALSFPSFTCDLLW